MSLIVRIKKKEKNFNLSVDFETKGTCLGILGASGCGKSMTLKCIAGIMTPDEGFIQLNGKVLFDSKYKINIKPQQRHVGYLFQSYALFPNMTVTENIATAIHASKTKKIDKVADMIRLLHLQGLEDRYPNRLSGGQQQRVALARILANEPDVLLLDEPFSALDAYLKEELQDQLLNLIKRYQGDSILVTHSRDEAYRLCEHLIILDDGKILEHGEIKEVFAKPKKVQAARLTGCKNFSRARQISMNQVEALDWGRTFTINAPIPTCLSHIGVRAHDFRMLYEEDNAVNLIPCNIHRIMEAPFEWNVLIKTEGQFIWWKIGKNQMHSDFGENIPRYLTVAPEDILLLEE